MHCEPDKEKKLHDICRITDPRKEKGFTQEELAKRANVSRATIIGLENGTITVTTTETLTKIAGALNKKVSDIFLA